MLSQPLRGRPPKGEERGYIIRNGYYMVYVAGRGYVYEHRLLAERKIGRPLVKGEVVHHLNGDKLDNRPTNLAVLTHSEHAAHHAIANGFGKGDTWKRKPPKFCEWCGAQMKRGNTRVKCCSQSCGQSLRYAIARGER